MKVGDKVKVLKDSSGPGGCYHASPPWKDEIVVITEKNIDDIEQQLRSGNMEMFEASKVVVKTYMEPIVTRTYEDTHILPDRPKTRTRGRKRNLQSNSE